MKEFLDANDIANEIRLSRTQKKCVYLIVEGFTDSRIYGNLIDPKFCEIILGHDKPTVIETIRILNSSAQDGVIAIVDSDFMKLEGKYPLHNNIFVTDTHDLESMIISSSAIDKILVEFTPLKNKEKTKVEIITFLLEAGKEMGYLRWISEPTKARLSLNFRKLDFENFVEKSSLRIDINKLVRTVVRNTETGSKLPIEKIIKIVDELKNEKHDLWQVCCGDDLIDLFVICLKNKFGIEKRCKKLDNELLRSILFISYDKSHFFSTKLYRSLKMWEEKNNPYKLFSE